MQLHCSVPSMLQMDEYTINAEYKNCLSLSMHGALLGLSILEQAEL